MLMTVGDRWHCTNLSCCCAIVVESGTSEEGGNPRCSCGSMMKKEYKSPVFAYLEFLHFEPPLVAAKKSEQE